jgi:tRNA threonylcarbamoyladenosine biosynthesis protein TsaB
VNILAFDTSSSACSVALFRSDQPAGSQITSAHQVAPMQQGHLILPLIDRLLAENNVELAQLDAIAYGQGPGSFTGLRIASGVAQGLSLPNKTPIIPISSLAILAATAFSEVSASCILTAVDARTSQLYVAGYKLINNACSLVLPEVLVTPDSTESVESFKNSLKSLVTENKWCGAGDGWVKYSNILSNCMGVEPTAIMPALLPNAAFMFEMARDKLMRGEWVKAEQAMPHYLR